MRQIHHLVKVEGLTLTGTAKRLRSEKRGEVDKIKVLDSLKEIRRQLQEVRSSL